ncbi:MAG: LysR family transcriptional regulator, partial [Myxococcota bacterium]
MNSPEHRFDWDDLRVFITVLQQGSLSRAANELGMSQPTVGRRLSAVEDALGGPLVERTPGGCHATAHGAMIAPLVEQMRAAADGVKRLASTARRDLEGTVRVAVGEMLGRRIARHSSEIVAGAPGLRLELVVGMERVNLSSGDAEIALRGRKPTSPQLYARKLGRAPWAIYAAPTYVDAHPEALDERRYQACRWASLDDSLGHLKSSRWLAER